jgi:methionyl-tRNA synthetase
VITEEEYKEFKRLKDGGKINVDTIEDAKCPVDDYVYPNANILAHHMKTHVNGFKCNICGKVFKTKFALDAHLRSHGPQVEPSKHSIFDSSLPSTTQTAMMPQSVRLAVPSIKRKQHKRRSVLNFESSKWLTLR